MTFDEYQQAASRTRRNLSHRDHLGNGGMGLAGEAGEVADHIKKHLFQDHDLDQGKIIKELGDVLWYAADTATTLGLSLSDIAAANVVKLTGRYPNGFEAGRSRVRLSESNGVIGGIVDSLSDLSEEHNVELNVTHGAAAYKAMGIPYITVDDLADQHDVDTGVTTYGTDTL